MQPKKTKTYFTLKITVLIALVLIHFGSQTRYGLNQITQLIQRYDLDDTLYEIGNSLSSLI